jgi:hypothetical protein
VAKSIIQAKQSESEWFVLVVENAISFLDSSVKSIETSPKNSIIDLYTAIELFFKARLMKEHWSLILAKPEEADINKFENGDFRSVFLAQAHKRLEKISKETFEKAALDNFLNLGMHRNQIVHFAHTDFKGDKASVIVELWASWFYIYELLTNQWAKYFDEYMERFSSINTEIRNHIGYLESVLDIRTPQIKIELEKGNEIVECPSCTLLSALIDKDTPITQVGKMRPVNTWGPINYPAKKYTCLVCNVKGFKIIDS